MWNMVSEPLENCQLQHTGYWCCLHMEGAARTISARMLVYRQPCAWIPVPGDFNPQGPHSRGQREADAVPFRVAADGTTYGARLSKITTSQSHPAPTLFNMPAPRTPRFSFAYNSILLDHRKIQTGRAMSRVKANYHLFLRNQPRKPHFKIQDLGPRRRWQVPKMRQIED
ncbi:hypothetical protein AYO20_00561 [Fonsecaea nubica]|uniref:Uncharacterized protein n=1 Tax=Fonsecaea nubica TaxID=856822 RepID=A0A178DG01_9EURO|nr:hypothetical protein AYO20_00561 [Fonsecaea nubica]OAL40141.1 hypothetical protein AYO20_00561 [Fonsecaea nubica]